MTRARIIAAVSAAVLVVIGAVVLLANREPARMSPEDTAAHLRGLVDAYGESMFCAAAVDGSSYALDDAARHVADGDRLDLDTTRGYLSTHCPSLRDEADDSYASVRTAFREGRLSCEDVDEAPTRAEQEAVIADELPDVTLDPRAAIDAYRDHCN